MDNVTLKHGKQYVIVLEDYPVYDLHYELENYTELPITGKELRILRLANTYRVKAQSILRRIYNAQDEIA